MLGIYREEEIIAMSMGNQIITTGRRTESDHTINDVNIGWR